MALDLQQLRQIVALAEQGSFVRAAATLHMSQPALSRSIQNLERRLGNPLLLRTSRGVVPTDLGRRCIDRSRDLLQLADELEQEVLYRGELRTGTVTVGGGPITSEAVLGRAAIRFVERFPGVSVRVHGRNWDELLNLLRSRELDFFVAETSTLQRERDVEVVGMQSSHAVYLVARAGHPLARRGGVTAADVFDWPFVTPGRVPPRILGPFLAARRSGPQRGPIPRPFPSIECNGLAPVKRIIADSDAITGSTLSCISTELENGTFVLLGTEPWLHMEYGFVRLKHHPRTQAAETFMEFVLDAERMAVEDEKRLVARFSPAISAPA